MKSIFLLFVIWGLAFPVYAQIHWHSPVKETNQVIQGQGWPQEMKGTYNRLPERAKNKVRPKVWNLSRNSAGLAIHFYTNAPQIIVRYQLTGGYAMPHMPATGVSGVDLYARNMNGEEFWCAGQYNFGDTIRYAFNNLVYGTANKTGYEYRLYLPLYNTVRWLEIGIPENCSFNFVPVRQEKPIVVYGTSIAQGACASRPGMIWTSQLERKLDLPFINLGFSGNGQLEKEVIDFICEQDAALYILDCLPNLTKIPVEKIQQLIIDAVLQLRSKRPQTPILLTEHDGYANQYTNAQQAAYYQKTNEASAKAYAILKEQKIPGLYYLSYAEIAMPQDAMVDGVHATDYGMKCYADAYEKMIREILHQPIGAVRTTIPVSQRRDYPFYDWKKRHAEILQLNRENPPRCVMIGNSITHYWGGQPEARIKRGQKSWDKYMQPAQCHNLGFGWDKIENMLWRIYHGELDGYRANKVILLAGTNNLTSDSDDDILTGIDTLISAIRYRQPQAEILVCSILPRRKMESRIRELNHKIRKTCLRRKVNYTDPGQKLLTRKGNIDETLFIDGLHPNEKGYDKIADLMNQ